MRPWMLGGIALIVCGVIGVLRSAVGAMPPAGVVMTAAADVFWAAGVLAFAIGTSAAGSVVARRSFGMAALAVVALWPLTSTILGLVMQAVLPPTEDVWMTWGYVTLVLPLVAGLIAVVQIARSDTVPAPWRWAPAAVLAVQVVAWLVPQFLMIAVGPAEVQQLVGLFAGLGQLSFLAATFGMGIVALVAAGRQRPESVQVFRSPDR